MARQPTRRVWASVTRAVLLLAVSVATIYLCGPPVITAVLHRPVTGLGPEDYAVYSGFVEGFLSSNQPFKADQIISPDSAVYVVGETSPIRSTDSILPLDVAVLGPEDMGEDFFRQNAHSWLLQPRFHVSRSISIVGHDMWRRAAWAGAEELFDRTEKGNERKGNERKWLAHASLKGPLMEAPEVSGVLQLSRVGFNRRKTLALLYYSYRCGVLCGQSGWVVLHKAGGGWQIEKFGRSAVY